MPHYANILGPAQLISSMGASACVDLFAAYGVTLRPIGSNDNGDGLLCGLMGFIASGVQGTCLLAGHREPIARSRPALGRNTDWIAELTNQLMGRLKAKVLGYGVELRLSAPVALSDVRIGALRSAAQRPVLFEAGGGSVLVWIELEMLPNFVLGPFQAHAKPRAAGQVVLF